MFQVNHLIGFGAFSADEAEFAIEFIGIVSGGADELGQPVVLTLPGDTADGDIILAIASSGNNATIAPPSGYTDIATADTAGVDYTTSYKSRSSDTTVTFSSLSRACIAMVFRYVDPTTPMDTTRTLANGASGDPDCASITTVTNNAVVVAVGFLDINDVDSATLSGFNDVTCIGDNGGSSTVTSSAMAGWARQATAGAVDPAAFVTPGSGAWRAVTIALRPQFPSASP